MMRRYLYILLCILLPYNLFAYNTVEIIQKLDKKIEHRFEYDLKKNNRINYLKSKVNNSNALKFNDCQKLFDEYYNYKIDSSFYYAKKMIEISTNAGDKDKYQLALIDYAKYFNGVCMYKESANILFPLKEKLLPSMKCKYYETLSQYYVWLTEYTASDSYKKIYRKRAYIYTDSLLKYRNKQTVEYKLSLAEFYRYNDINKAISIMKPIVDTMNIHNSDLRLTACNLAESYEKINDVKAAKYYFAISAMSDIDNGIKEHSALHRLALILINEGDIDRAYIYLKCCIEDANFSNAKLRTIESVPDFSRIYELYQNKAANNKRSMYYSIIGLIVLSLGLLLTLLLLYRSNYKLNIARLKVISYNSNLEKLNEKMKNTIENQTLTNLALKESDRIKETYIVQYMRNCISYIDKLDAYRHSLNKLALSDNKNMLYLELKSTRYIDKELKTFYKEFDNTFLSLFPNFVEDFNNLLIDEEKIYLPLNTLNPELRIFALIRLGVTDSNDIASFLQYSVKTIYNYRVKVRNKAKGKRDDLEEKIKKIGSMAV